MKFVSILLLLFAFVACTELSTRPSNVVSISTGEPGLIGGTVSKYFEWDRARFDQAVKEGKIIYLEFSANWCSTCKSQEPHLKAGFEELSNPNVVGFKIHYKDDQTTPEMEELARQYGIAYQHTKVILQDGKVVKKSPEAWDYKRFLEEMKKIG